MPDISKRPYIPEVQNQTRRTQRITRFTHSATLAAGVMLLAAVIALVVANTGAYGFVEEIWHSEIGVFVGGNIASMSLLHLVNDILMAVFFLHVGLEIKHEMTVGDLADFRKALLPILGALGGVVVPIVLYLIFNRGTANVHGWGVPTATDIAFALGVLALLGNRIPPGIRLFLSTLAIADDIIAILIIAIFYGRPPSVFWLLASGLVFVGLILLNRAHVYAISPYLGLGMVLWICMFFSGIHTTIAGVLLAFSIPTKTKVDMGNFGSWLQEQMESARTLFDPDTPILAQARYTKTIGNISKVVTCVTPPLTRLERAIDPWVAFLILPLFALGNAGVRLAEENVVTMLTNPVSLGIFFGLFLGKPIGIFALSWISVKLKICDLPKGVNWFHMLGAGMLGGIGFTMAIFVANLSFADSETTAIAKAAILSASAAAGIVGYLFLRHQAKKDASLEAESPPTSR